MDNRSIQIHRLKVPASIPVGDGDIEAAHFRGNGVQTGPASHHRRPQFLAVLDDEERLVRKTADDTIGPVDDQPTAGMLEMSQKRSVRMLLQILIL